jgi:hypothetical protein
MKFNLCFVNQLLFRQDITPCQQDC